MTCEKNRLHLVFVSTARMVLALSLAVPTHGEDLMTLTPRAGDFILSSEDTSAKIVLETSTDPAVARAARDLASDIERVTGRTPDVVNYSDSLSGNVVLVGVLGQSPVLDRLAAAGKFSVTGLPGGWETYVVQVVDAPLLNVPRALVIGGSDRRGAIYGLYEVSAAIGVSPWYWWADVAPAKQTQLAIAAGAHRFGPPSVKYRGVFLNDEDWGLQPWAAKTFEPETGNIGPKTYARLFELMLRLKANTVWPAMHPTTKPFNAFPENKTIADAYGIVMGSSHAEPMLRNNVGEWTAPKEDYNYVTNRAGVLRYWEERVQENGRFENIYTLGMRGIHDSNMQGPTTDPERIRVLEQIFADQRALLATHVRPDVQRVPQMFCAYKEVLDLYRQGLRVPDDVTIVWPDDNFGYVRNFASPAERGRAGGFGVYYHLSYLGAPLSYLWLSTTPPALIWEEMHKAYEHGADRLWIANVGDLKPAEIPTEFFLQLAWDIDRWRPDNLPDFLRDWAGRNFGTPSAESIANLLSRYFLLNFQRQPEHLQWWLPRQPRTPSALTDREVNERLEAFAALRTDAETLRVTIPAARQDAFYELVFYPIVGSALANQRFFVGERGDVAAARAADAELHDLTRTFNETIAHGKWRGILSLEPADQQWSSMRVSPWSPPPVARPPVGSPPSGTYFAVSANHFARAIPGAEARWTRMAGLGRTGQAMTVLPTTAPALELSAANAAPRLEYGIVLPRAGDFPLHAFFLPTHPLAGKSMRIAIAVDDLPPQLVALEVADGGPAWAQGVLNEERIADATVHGPEAGSHVLKVYGLDPGIVLEKLVLDFGGLTPTYLGPPDSTEPPSTTPQPATRPPGAVAIP